MSDTICEYAPAPESRSIVDIRPSYGLFIDGEFVQERSRELAVLESIDNGKPIRESRDVDLPGAIIGFT